MMDKHRLGALFAKYTIPTVIATIISGLYLVVDGYFIGNYVGAEGLASFNLLWPPACIIIGGAMLIGVGAGCQFSIYQGSGKHELADKVLAQVLPLVVIFSVILIPILLLGSDKIIYWQGGDALSNRLAFAYFRPYVLAVPITLFACCIPILLRNLQAPRFAMFCLVLSTLINIMLDYVFIGVMGFGMAGAAYATIIAEVMVIILGLTYIITVNTGVRFKISYFIPNLILLKDIIINGFSTLIGFMYSGLTVLLHNTQLLTYGNMDYLAIYSIIGYLIMILTFTIEGIAAGMQPISSYFYGARELLTTKRVFLIALYWGLGIGIAFTLFVQYHPTFFVQLFVENRPDLYEKAAFVIRLNLFFVFSEALFMIASLFYQSIGQGSKALIVMLISIILQIPLLIILPLFLGVNGVLLAFPFSTIVLSIIVLFLLKNTFRKFDKEVIN